MAKIDLLIGINADRLNQIINQAFSNQAMRAHFFTGTQGGVFQSVNYTANWQLQSVPSVELRTPTQDEWNQSIKADGNRALPVANAFITNLNDLSISLTLAGATKQTSTSVKAICTASVNGNTTSISALAVIVDLSGCAPFDLFITKTFIIPNVLTSVTSTLSGINVQPPSISGINLTPPTVAIQNNALLLAFNLVQDSQPDLTGFVAPSQPFFILASQDLMQAAVNYVVTNNIQGKSFSKSGSDGALGFSGEYSANGNVNGISVNTTNNPTQLHANVNFSLSASAGISTPLGYIIEGGKVILSGLETAGETIGHYANPSNW